MIREVIETDAPAIAAVIPRTIATTMKRDFDAKRIRLSHTSFEISSVSPKEKAAAL